MPEHRAHCARRLKLASGWRVPPRQVQCGSGRRHQPSSSLLSTAPPVPPRSPTLSPSCATVAHLVLDLLGAGDELQGRERLLAVLGLRRHGGSRKWCELRTIHAVHASGEADTHAGVRPGRSRKYWETGEEPGEGEGGSLLDGDSTLGQALGQALEHKARRAEGATLAMMHVLELPPSESFR